MGVFTKISAETFNELQTEAGVLLKKFDPENVTEPADEDIICATTGGINASCVATFSDWGEDIDNCPPNMKELKQVDSWEAKLSFTALNITPETIKLSLGVADIDASKGKITPRANLKQTDFTDTIWWVGDMSDGGMCAVCLKNALSTDGLSLQTAKKGKGQLSVGLTGHYSMSTQTTVPMDFYVTKGTAGEVV